MFTVSRPVRLANSNGLAEFDELPTVADEMHDTVVGGIDRGFTLADEDDAREASDADARSAAEAFYATMTEMDLIAAIREAANTIGRSGIERAVRLAGV